MRLAKKLIRAATKRLRIAFWWVGSPLFRAPLTGGMPVVVSLTSYRQRIPTLFAVLESIGAGECRPQRLVLWLAHDEVERGLPRTLRNLTRRGLEIKACDDYRSHKKYYPYATENVTIPLPLVTADDDVLYPRGWLNGLFEAHRKHPSSTVGYRGEIVGFDEGGAVLPYQEWGRAASAAPSFRLQLNGIGGVIYPIPVLEEARRYGTTFMKLAPRADDLWLHRSALRTDAVPRLVSADVVDFPAIPGSQRSSLMSTNIQAGNDEQFAALYSENDIMKIFDDAVPEDS